MSLNVNNTKNIDNNRIDIFMLVMVLLPLVSSVISLILFFIGVTKSFYPYWLFILLIINIFILPIIDLVLLSSDGVSFTEPVKSSIFCFPLYVYFREKMTDNNQILFIISIISYIVSVFMFFMHILSNGVDLGTTIIYILIIYGIYALLLKLFTTKEDDGDSVYTVYMMQTVLLLTVAIAIQVLKTVAKI